MRICLITEVYPALEQSDAACQYITKLANGLIGLAENANQVTVICERNLGSGTGERGISVVEVAKSQQLRDLKLVPLVMPGAMEFAYTHLNYWHALSDVLNDEKFDVVETTYPLVATLLSAMTRQTATVVRIEDAVSHNQGNFDVVFQNLIVNYALSCVDAYSSSRSGLESVDSERICINSESDDSDLALRALEIYEIALERHKSIGRPDLYRHGSERLIKSTEDMIELYDEMLYNMLFRVSYRFRIVHWWRSLRSSPQSFTTKFLQKLSPR